MSEKQKRNDLSMAGKMAIFSCELEHPEATSASIGRVAAVKVPEAPTSTAFMASSSQNEAPTSSRKRKQSSITDFFAKKCTNKKEYKLNDF